MNTTTTVNLTADEWGLLTLTYDCTDVAQALSKAATEALTLPTAPEAFYYWQGQADGWGCGASDTEPREVMWAIIERAYA